MPAPNNEEKAKRRKQKEEGKKEEKSKKKKEDEVENNRRLGRRAGRVEQVNDFKGEDCWTYWETARQQQSHLTIAIK